MTTPVDAIAGWLTTQGVAGGSTAWPIHRLSAQETPHEAVAIYETGGMAPEHATDKRWSFPAFQLVARGRVQSAAEAKSWEIFDALDQADIPGFVFLVAQQSTPIGLGQDIAGRYRFSLNFRGGAS